MVEDSNTSIKDKLAEEVARKALGIDDVRDKDEVDAWLEENGVTAISNKEESYSQEGDPFEDDPILAWGDGDGHTTSLEFNLIALEPNQEYHVEIQGVRHKVTVRELGKDRFDIDIKPED